MSKTRRVLLHCVGLAAGVFVLLQFFRPELPNPPVTAELSAPAPVKAILRRACYDCHSNETRLPWFDQIVPAYWLVVRDVTEGRRRLNFSELGKLPLAKQNAALFESVNHVLLGAMPPKPYLAIHPGARVSDDDIITLKDYLRKLAVAPEPRAGRSPLPSPPSPPLPAPNGIAFPADYGAWKPISGSERFDNGTVRAILGNAVAIQAIRDDEIAPWPDGAALAKVAWKLVAEPDGGAHAGDFWQVELMFKDRERYAGTLGWGFARWRGNELLPYGKDASFAEECVGCHAPLKESDAVFTRPIRRSAELPEGLDPLAGRVLGLSVNPERSTFSMLLGDHVAASHARTRSNEPYPPGSILVLATWSASDDERWFGARTPGAVASIDVLKRNGESWLHEAYARGPAKLERLPSGDPSRTAEISSRTTVTLLGATP